MKIKYYFWGIIFTLALFLIGNGFGFQKLDTIFWDNLQQTYTSNVREDITIIGIDDDSLAEIGAWPWKREVFADLIQKLDNDGARVIGLDITFLDDREGDPILRKTITNAKSTIVLASKIIENQHLLPIISSSHIGFSNILQGNDGIVRDILLNISVNDNNIPSFAQQLYLAYIDNHPRKESMLTWFQTIPEPVQFIYGAGDFHTISVNDILNGNYDKAKIKDHIVIVGSTVSDLRLGLDDNVSKVGGVRISGVILQAYFVSALLDKSILLQIPFLANIAIMAFLAISLLFVFTRTKNSIYDVGIGAGVNIAIFIISIFLFDIGVLIPAISYIITIFGIVIYNVAARYVKEKEAKQFISDAFSKYMNPDLLEKLIENPELLQLGGEKKEVTMLFGDIRDFTSLSEKVPPEKLINLLNSYMDKMSNVVFANSGIVDKFIGDAVMAVWNSLVDDQNHAKHTVKAAIAMIEALKEFNNEISGTGLAMGIGVHTGEVIVGNMGSAKRFEFTVIGDNVNLTDRLLGLTKKYGVDILISGETLREIGELEGYVFRKIDEVIVKGKMNSMLIYEPLQINGHPENIKIKENYENAFTMYQNRKMTKALDLLAQNTNDKPSIILAERIRYIGTPSQHWNAVWRWDKK